MRLVADCFVNVAGYCECVCPGAAVTQGHESSDHRRPHTRIVIFLLYLEVIDNDYQRRVIIHSVSLHALADCVYSR